MLVWTILTNAPNPLEFTTFTKKMGEWATRICIFMRPFWVVPHIILNDLWTTSSLKACSLRIPQESRTEPGWSTLKSRNIEIWILGTKPQQKLNPMTTIFHLTASPNGPCCPPCCPTSVLCHLSHPLLFQDVSARRSRRHGPGDGRVFPKQRGKQMGRMLT